MADGGSTLAVANLCGATSSHHEMVGKEAGSGLLRPVCAPFARSVSCWAGRYASVGGASGRGSHGMSRRSARTMVGRIRGRPGPVLGTRMRAMTVSEAGASPAWPAVPVRAKGRAWLSAVKWILVPNPPRERPSAWSAGSFRYAAPFSALRRRAGGYGRQCSRPRPPVNLVGGIGCREDDGEDFRPRAVDSPPDQAFVSGLKRTGLVGEVPPGRVAAVLPHDGPERAAMVGPP